MQAIPGTAEPFFQEYNFKSLDPERDRDLVIERLLAFGNRDEMRWLLRNYGLPSIQLCLSEPGARRLPRRRYRLWCVLLDVTEAQREQAPIWPY